MMPSRSFAFLFFVAVSNAATASGEVLSPAGYGQVRFGAKLSEVEAKLKQKASPKQPDPGCDFVRFKKYPRIRFMVEQGLVTRADADPGIKNSAGVAVGMSLARVKVLHPKIRVEPHKYDEEGHYLILPSANGQAALVFEESKGKVTDVRAGTEPSVEYVEGCL